MSSYIAWKSLISNKNFQADVYPLTVKFSFFPPSNLCRSHKMLLQHDIQPQPVLLSYPRRWLRKFFKRLPILYKTVPIVEEYSTFFVFYSFGSDILIFIYSHDINKLKLNLNKTIKVARPLLKDLWKSGIKLDKIYYLKEKRK